MFRIYVRTEIETESVPEIGVTLDPLIIFQTGWKI